MGMDTSCGNKISLSKLFLFFFFQAFINVLDFLQHQFHVFLQALNLAGDVGHQCISLLGRRIQEAKVVFPVKVGHCQAKSLKRTPVGVSPSGVSSVCAA